MHEDIRERMSNPPRMAQEATAAIWRRAMAECDGHPAGPHDPMGATVYCNGSCQLHSAEAA